MYSKKLVGVVGFYCGVASVAAQCDEVRAGWGKDIDNELAMYAEIPTGGYVSHKYNEDNKDSTIIALLHDLCQNAMYCSHYPLVDGRCLEEGTEFIQPYLIDGDVTEITIAMGEFVNKIIKNDNMIASKNNVDDDDNTAEQDIEIHGKSNKDYQARRKRW